MSYITPNNTVYILSGVPLDPTYDHTIYFSPDQNGLTAQYNYFFGKKAFSLTAQTYQRVNRGWLRVGIEADNLYNCNYLMFQNTNFGNKWFYAFIKTVEYINHSVSEIEYEIDVMQTWNAQYTLDMCYVEREHSASDGLFENIIEENVNLGNEYTVKSKQTFDLNDMDICILHNRINSSDGTVLNGVFIPIQISSGMSATAGNLASINTVIDRIGENNIISVYQYPEKMRNDTNFETPTYEFEIDPDYGTIDGYTPRNVKLYSYPYYFLVVSNNSGQTAEYKWEDFLPGQPPTFEITGTFCTTPCVICYPTFYKSLRRYYDEGLLITNFPICAWGDNTFKTWWAENQNSYVTSGLTSVASSVINGAITGVMTGNPTVATIATGVSVASNIANSVAKIQDIKAMPNQTYGQVQTDCLNAKLRRIQFDFYRMSIKSQYAKIIDDYFDRYGYATKRNKVPNRNVRPHWCYTKTIACTITGSLPADDARKICSIYDNGITFWKDGDEVGHYNLDNTIPS